MWEQYKFENIIHAVGIGQSVTNSDISREQIKDVEGYHSIRRILRE